MTMLRRYKEGAAARLPAVGPLHFWRFRGFQSLFLSCNPLYFHTFSLLPFSRLTKETGGSLLLSLSLFFPLTFNTTRVCNATIRTTLSHSFALTLFIPYPFFMSYVRLCFVSFVLSLFHSFFTILTSSLTVCRSLLLFAMWASVCIYLCASRQNFSSLLSLFLLSFFFISLYKDQKLRYQSTDQSFNVIIIKHTILSHTTAEGSVVWSLSQCLLSYCVQQFSPFQLFYLR